MLIRFCQPFAIFFMQLWGKISGGFCIKNAAESAHWVYHKIRTYAYCAVQLNVVKIALFLIPHYITIVFKLSNLILCFEWIPRPVR